MDKPLHVSVAEALGWKQRGPDVIGDRDCGGTEWWVPPDSVGGSYCNACRPEMAPPRYDTDWSATGPLIEKYGIGLYLAEGFCKDDGCGTDNECCDDSCPCWQSAEWWASKDDDRGEGATPLIAACNLILALHAAGKLHPVIARRAAEPATPPAPAR